MEYREPWLVVGGSVAAWLVGGVLGLKGAAAISISIAGEASCWTEGGIEAEGGQLAVLILRKAAAQDCRIWAFCCLVRATWFGFGLRRHSGESAGWGPWQWKQRGGHGCAVVEHGVCSFSV